MYILHRGGEGNEKLCLEFLLILYFLIFHTSNLYFYTNFVHLLHGGTI